MKDVINDFQADNPLAGLCEPTDQPRSPQKIPEMSLGRNIALPWSVILHCLNRQKFSLASLYEHAELVREGYKGWEYASQWCGDGDGGQKLWILDGFYLPCRENAVKAVRRIPAPIVVALTEQSRFATVEHLVKSINALPAGLEMIPIGASLPSNEHNALTDFLTKLSRTRHT
jgi:hypothetical protein